MLSYDPQSLDIKETYSLMIRSIVPRPIAWVSSCSDDGAVNLAPFSYFNGLCSNPPAIMFSPVNWPDGEEKDTTKNIRETGEFVVNIVPFELAEQMHQTSERYPREVNEFEAVGLTALPSLKVRPPRVEGSPIHFECKLLQIVDVGTGPFAANVIIGEVVMFHVSPAVCNQDNKIDPKLLDAVGRMGGREYVTIRDRFEV